MAIISIISIYLLGGVFTSLLVEMAYAYKNAKHDHFQDLDGEYNNVQRIMTIVLWPLVWISAVILIIKQRLGK